MLQSPEEQKLGRDTKFCLLLRSQGLSLSSGLHSDIVSLNLSQPKDLNIPGNGKEWTSINMTKPHWKCFLLYYVHFVFSFLLRIRVIGMTRQLYLCLQSILINIFVGSIQKSVSYLLYKGKNPRAANFLLCRSIDIDCRYLVFGPICGYKVSNYHFYCAFLIPATPS